MALLIQMANSLLACYTGTALKEMVMHGNTPLESKSALAGMKPRGHPLGLFLSLFFQSIQVGDTPESLFSTMPQHCHMLECVH